MSLDLSMVEGVVIGCASKRKLVEVAYRGLWE